MQTPVDGTLDPNLLAYFRSRYAALDEEEITELAARRDTLADEAAAALDDTLRSRGISVAAVAAASTPRAEAPLEQQISLARDLWASGAAKWGQFLCMAAFLALAGPLAKHVPRFGSAPAAALFSASLAGLLVAAMGYGGYRFGRYCTKSICGNGDKPAARRRRELRWFAAAVIPACFVLYVLLLATLPGQ